MSHSLEHSSSKVNSIIISKAKKREGYYICPVSSSTKNSFLVNFNNASVVDVKETSHTIVLKCKDMTRYMDALNDVILDIVRDNSSSWFKSKIDDDLIDEYYISTLQYDKKRGETIRLKLKNIDEFEDQCGEGKVNLVVCLKYIKFYKQKFFPEFEIESIDQLQDAKQTNNFICDSDDDVDFLEEDDEYPLPSVEEIQHMKSDCLKALNDMKQSLALTQEAVTQKLTDTSGMIYDLESCSDLYEIVKLCEESQTFLCE